MAITLEKGQKISLSKEAGAGLSRVYMGLGWDAAQTPKRGGFLGALFGGGGSGSIDLDANALLFDSGSELVDVVWFQQLRSKDGSIQHSGDNRTGDGDGDDETIAVNLFNLPANVQTVVFTVNNFTGQDFSQVANAYCRLVNAQGNQEIARYNLSAQGSHSAMIMTALKREGSDWSLTAIGVPSKGRTYRDNLPDIQPYV